MAHRGNSGGNTKYLHYTEMFPQLQPGVIYDICEQLHDEDLILEKLFALADSGEKSPPTAPPPARPGGGFQQPQHTPAPSNTQSRPPTYQDPATRGPSLYGGVQPTPAPVQQPNTSGRPPGYPGTASTPAASTAAQPTPAPGYTYGAGHVATATGFQQPTWGTNTAAAQPAAPRPQPAATTTTTTAPAVDLSRYGYSTAPAQNTATPAGGNNTVTPSAIHARNQVEQMLRQPVNQPIGGRPAEPAPPVYHRPPEQPDAEELRREEERERELARRLAQLQLSQAMAAVAPEPPKAEPQKGAPKLPPGFGVQPAAKNPAPKASPPPATPPAAAPAAKPEEDSGSEEEGGGGWWIFGGKKKKKDKDKKEKEKKEAAEREKKEREEKEKAERERAEQAKRAEEARRRQVAAANGVQPILTPAGAAAAPPISPANHSPAANVRSFDFREAPPPPPPQPRLTREGEFSFTECARDGSDDRRRFDTLLGSFVVENSYDVPASATRRREELAAVKQAVEAAPKFNFNVAPGPAPGSAQQSLSVRAPRPYTSATAAPSAYTPGQDPLARLAGFAEAPQANAGTHSGTVSFDALLANFANEP